MLLTCLAFTWLNPHVYLDTVVLLGSVAAGRGGQRWWFAAGAAAASTLWFCALGAGATALRPLFARPAAWRALDAGIAVVMAVVAARPDPGLRPHGPSGPGQWCAARWAASTSRPKSAVGSRQTEWAWLAPRWVLSHSTSSRGPCSR